MKFQEPIERCRGCDRKMEKRLLLTSFYFHCGACEEDEKVRKASNDLMKSKNYLISNGHDDIYAQLVTGSNSVRRKHKYPVQYPGVCAMGCDPVLPCVHFSVHLNDTKEIEILRKGNYSLTPLVAGDIISTHRYRAVIAISGVYQIYEDCFNRM